MTFFPTKIIYIIHLYIAEGNTVFPLIEAGSQIQAGPLIEAGGLNSNIIELGPNCTSPGSTVVYSVIRAYCVISRTAVWPTEYFA